MILHSPLPPWERRYQTLNKSERLLVDLLFATQREILQAKTNAERRRLLRKVDRIKAVATGDSVGRASS